MPARKVLLQKLQRLRVGVGRSVLAGRQAGVAADQDQRPVGLARGGLARLGADGVQARGDVAQRRHEGAVRRAHADGVAVRRDRPTGCRRWRLRRCRRSTSRRASGLVARVPEAGRESRPRPWLTLVEPSRSAEAVSRAPPEAVVEQSQRAAQGVAQGASWRRAPGAARRAIEDAAPRGELVDGRHARRARARPRGRAASSRSRAATSRAASAATVGGSSSRRRRTMLQRLPEALLADLVAGGPGAARVAGRAGRQRRPSAPAGELGEGLIEARGAELVAGAVRGAALDAVVPALARAVDERGGLAVVDAPAAWRWAATTC